MGSNSTLEVVVMDSWLVRAARARPRAEAVNGVGYARLLERAAGLARTLPAGARVGIALPAGVDFVVALHATWLAGAVAVPHDLRLLPAERPPADLVLDAAALDASPGASMAGRRTINVQLPAIDELGGPVGGLAGARIDLAATAVVLRTSGTTGAPKEIHLSFGNLLWSALGSAVALGARPDDRWLSALPPTHVGGLSVITRSAIQGTACRLLERWDTDAVLEALPQATLVSVVPTTLQRLLEGDPRPARLRWALLGGAPISDALTAEAHARGIPVAPTYGLTEATSQVTTFGVPLFCTRVGLEPDGEILVTGPTVAGGGTLRTGDLGAWDDEGRLRIVGRKADTIITGGENVAPTEVEHALEAHPAVRAAAVLGVPDPEWGERLVALVVGRPVSDEELREHLRGRVARFKVPKAFRWVDDLPRTGSGKLRRAGLRWQ
jgi:O-succinylbenzoic acid--CoA ligase